MSASVSPRDALPIRPPRNIFSPSPVLSYAAAYSKHDRKKCERFRSIPLDIWCIIRSWLDTGKSEVLTSRRPSPPHVRCRRALYLPGPASLDSVQSTQSSPAPCVAPYLAQIRFERPVANLKSQKRLLLSTFLYFSLPYPASYRIEMKHALENIPPK
jgi:hypothetical protein